MLVPKSGRDESQDRAREGSTDEGRGRRDVAHAVGSVGERHVRADLAACVWAAWKEVSVGVPTRQVWGPARRDQLLPYARSPNGGQQHMVVEYRVIVFG